LVCFVQNFGPTLLKLALMGTGESRAADGVASAEEEIAYVLPLLDILKRYVAQLSGHEAGLNIFH